MPAFGFTFVSKLTDLSGAKLGSCDHRSAGTRCAVSIPVTTSGAYKDGIALIPAT